MIYKFRLQFEEYEDSHWDLEIKSVQTFENLHIAIQKAIKFDGTQMASFFMSNDNWRKGTEIALMDLSEDEPKKAEMHKSVLADFIDDPHQKILYEMEETIDGSSPWTLGLELIKISNDDPKVSYPQCVKQTGTAPRQYKPSTIPSPDEDDAEVFVKSATKTAPIFEAEELIGNPAAEEEDDLAFGFGEEGEEETEEGNEEEEGQGEESTEEYDEEK